MTRPVRMRGSSGRWAPIATAESWNAGTPACNAFGFRFERVSVSYGGGGSWRPFVSGHRFLDGTHALRDLAAAPAESGVYRTLTSEAVLPYAFTAASRELAQAFSTTIARSSVLPGGSPMTVGQAATSRGLAHDGGTRTPPASRET